MSIAGAYFFVYAAQFLSCSLRQKHPLLDVNPVGSTFNIQNSIPHKSQKPKAVAEINRPIEFQRGTTGVAESTKKRTKALFEETDILLGPGDRAFESHYSDQVMIIRTTLSKWVMCSDLSFLLKMCFNRQGRVDKLALAFLLFI